MMTTPLDGYHTTQEIADDPQLRHVPIVMVSVIHLFEEFYRAPNARTVEAVGTGLELSIAKDLLDQYGGRVGVESTVGQGTTFTVIFPLVTHK